MKLINIFATSTLLIAIGFGPEAKSAEEVLQINVHSKTTEMESSYHSKIEFIPNLILEGELRTANLDDHSNTPSNTIEAKRELREVFGQVPSLRVVIAGEAYDKLICMYPEGNFDSMAFETNLNPAVLSGYEITQSDFHVTCVHHSKLKEISGAGYVKLSAQGPQDRRESYAVYLTLR